MYLEENAIKEYPAHIVRPFNAYEQADEESAMHKSLLDLGESLLTYIVGIMFGEYKKSGKISEKLETIVGIAEETTAGAQQTSESSHEVARLAEELQQSIRQFKV